MVGMDKHNGVTGVEFVPEWKVFGVTEIEIAPAVASKKARRSE